MWKFRDIKVEDALSAMKGHVENGRMCLLVGAGVSRCACELYQGWYGFIRDMVAFLYADELSSKGVKVTKDDQYYCHYLLEKIDNDSDIDIERIINGIIEREGVLSIPSQFQERTGLRESIEAYIESHTPRIDNGNDTASLFGKTESLGSNTDFLTSMFNVGWNAIFTTNYDNLLHHVAIKSGKPTFNESHRAADLSLRSMRNMIIKLHGSIDFDHKSNGFDSDKHRKYVLTQEDYDDYPVEHEAFMQLMRISLLKDCLCIVGFSGKDANFISWINWVRKIIESNSSINNADNPKAEDIKIFFIDVIVDKQDEATELYFENHRIYRISLANDEVKKLIDAEALSESNPEFGRQLFQAFFDYLSDKEGRVLSDDVGDEIKSEPKGKDNIKSKSAEVKTPDKTDATQSEEQSILHDTFSLWSKAYKLTGKNQDVDIDESAANRLIRYDSYMRLMRGTHYQSMFINVMTEKQELSETEAIMSLMALEQMQGDYDGKRIIVDKIEKTLQDKNYQERIKRLRNRHHTLVDPLESVNGSSDMVYYERCVRLAFTFAFKQLHDELKNWMPSEDFIMKKLILLSIVDMQAANDLISQPLLDKMHPSIERFRATQLANILSGNMHGVYSVDEFTDLSQHSIFSLRDWYFDYLTRPREKIHSYGKEVEEKKEISVDVAVRCLNFMLETPLMPHIGIWSIVSNEQWYKVAHALFEKYPYPVLFYSSTINDSNTLRRIGQDFAYSKVLHGQLPEFVVKMFSLIIDKDSPKSYWMFNNICILLREMIKAVPPSHWETFLLRLWKEDFLPELSETYKSDTICQLIYSGLSCSKSEDLASTIINDCLKVVRQNGKYDIVQNIFYYLRTKHSRKVSNAIKQSLTEFICKINNINDFILLGNLHRVITKPQSKEIAQKIPDVIPSSSINASSINGLVYYAKSNKNTLQIVKDSLIKSKIWGNGVQKNGRFVQSNYIPIVDLDDTLKWTINELHVIYDKLVACARPLLKEKESGDFMKIMHYEDLIFEMMRFIDIHRTELSDEEGLNFLYSELEEKYKQLTNYRDLEKSIFSCIDDEVDACLSVLAAKVKTEGISNYITYIDVLVARLLCRNRISYAKVLNYMQYFVRFYLKTADDLKLIPQLPLLIDTLTLDEFKNLEQDVIFCAELSILMAERLHELGLESKGVIYWINLKHKRFFNWSICDNV